MSVLTLEAKLERLEPATPWGFRMQGGKDFHSPLTIQRVTPGSLASKCGLLSGDIILKIGKSEADVLKHKEAQDKIITCGNKLDLLLQRIREKKKILLGKFGGACPDINRLHINSSPTPPFRAPSPTPIIKAPSPTPVAPSPPPPPPPITITNNAGVNYNATARPFPFGSGGVVLPPMSSSPGPQFNAAPPPPPPAAPQPMTYVPPPPMAPMARATPPAPAPPPPAHHHHHHAPPAPVAAAPSPARSFAAIPPPAQAPAPAPPRPKAPPAKPTGVGATKGKRGDAVYRTQDSLAGRVPVCAACGTQIRGPFVLAMSKSWCPEHFVCANPNCGVKLFDIGFVEEGGFLYCEKDYEQFFAPHCSKCSGVIVGECVNALNTTFHPQCFTCVQCKKPMGNSSFHIEDGEYYCDDDWKAQFQAVCFGCKYAIDPGDRWVEALDHSYHSDCFTCTTCHVSLEGQPFYAKGGKPFCKKHAR